MRMLLSFAILFAALFIGGCNSPRSAEGSESWQRSEMSFGLSRQGAADVTADEWRDFVMTQVVPAFPRGFTELSAEGFFRESGMNHREPVRVLIILSPTDQTTSANKRMDDLGRAYCQRFGLNAVLRSDSLVQLSFIQASLR